MSRPILNNKISLNDFQQYYWLKKELQIFCKSIGLNSTGSKIELVKRLEKFLRTKTISKNFKPVIKPPDKRDYKNLTPQKKIGKNYKSAEPLRIFFKSVIGKNFKFTAAFQKFCQKNPNKTYQDAVNFWHKNKNVKSKKIPPQFEYNTYIRDFMATNKNKKLFEAIICWKHKKSLPCNNKYNAIDLIALKK